MDTRTSRYYTYIKPVINNKAVQTYSTLVFSLIMVTIFAIFAIRPTISTILELQTKLNEQNNLLKRLETKQAALYQARANYEAIPAPTKARLSALLPSYTALPEVIESINSLISQAQASSSGLQFENIELVGQPKQLATNPAMEEIEFTFTIQGGYSQLISFLNSLSRSNRLIVPLSLNFNKGAEGQLILSVNAKTYYFKN